MGQVFSQDHRVGRVMSHTCAGNSAQSGLAIRSRREYQVTKEEAMSPTQVVVIVLVVLVVAAGIALAVTATRRRQLRQRFGPEYDRVVAERANRGEAEKELRA